MLLSSLFYSALFVLDSPFFHFHSLFRSILLDLGRDADCTTSYTFQRLGRFWRTVEDSDMDFLYINSTIWWPPELQHAPPLG